MPIREALFWVGLTTFGTGLTIVFGDHKLIASMLMLAGLSVVAYSVYLHHRPQSKIRLPLWFVLLPLTWLGICYDLYDRKTFDTLTEFDDVQRYPYKAYGHRTDLCYVTVNGEQFLKYKAKYRLAMACYIYDGSTPLLDAPDVQVSQAFDIRPSEIQMTVHVNPRLIPLPEGGENFVVLLVPFNVSISQFSTFRQARALGVKIKIVGGQTVAR